MHPVINKNGDVLTRYVIEDIKNTAWDKYYSQIPAYKLVCVLRSDEGRVYGRRMIYRVALFQEWLKEKEDSGEGYKCLRCKDTGLTMEDLTDRDYCTCDLGKSAKKAFSNVTNIRDEKYEEE